MDDDILVIPGDDFRLRRDEDIRVGPYGSICPSSNDEIRLTIQNVGLLAEECILFVLRCYYLDWYPPVSRQALSANSEYSLFSNEMGRALVHSCLVHESEFVAEMAGFSVDAWLQMPVDDARSHISRHFLNFTFVLPPRDEYKHLYLWCHACYLCRQAASRNRKDFLPDILAQLVIIMYSNYKHLSYYERLKEKATLYNRLHSLIHDFIWR